MPGVDPTQFQNEGTDVATALGMLLRGIDVPRQATLDYAAGQPIGNALGQVLDPRKALRGQDVVQRQLPELINRSPATATAVGTALELADPLIALGGASKALGLARGLGEVGEAGWRIGQKLPGAAKMLTNSTAEFKSLGSMPREVFDMHPRGFILPDGKVVADVRGKLHLDIQEMLKLPSHIEPTAQGGWVRFDTGASGGIGLQFNPRYPKAVSNARKMLENFAAPDTYTMLDIELGKGVQSYQVDAKEALKIIDNISESGSVEPTAYSTVEEALNAAYERGKKFMQRGLKGLAGFSAADIFSKRRPKEDVTPAEFNLAF